jgi:hypothetical protein
MDGKNEALRQELERQAYAAEMEWMRRESELKAMREHLGAWVKHSGSAEWMVSDKYGVPPNEVAAAAHDSVARGHRRLALMCAKRAGLVIPEDVE